MSPYTIRYKSNNNVVYSYKYHVVWCPKYRRTVLVNGVDMRLKEIIQGVCTESRAEILELEVMPDHVHPSGSRSPIRHSSLRTRYQRAFVTPLASGIRLVAVAMTYALDELVLCLHGWWRSTRSGEAVHRKPETGVA